MYTMKILDTIERQNAIRFKVMAKKEKRVHPDVYHAVTVAVLIPSAVLIMSSAVLQVAVSLPLAIVAIAAQRAAFWESWYIKEKEKRNLETEL